MKIKEDTKNIFSACRMVQLPNVLQRVTVIGQYTRLLKQRRMSPL